MFCNLLFFLSYIGPEKPSNITTTAPGTDYLNISWSLPRGRVDKYMVNISNNEKNYFNSSTTEDTKDEFTDLHPGRIFNVTVTAIAGNFSETSDQFSFATRELCVMLSFLSKCFLQILCTIIIILFCM